MDRQIRLKWTGHILACFGYFSLWMMAKLVGASTIAYISTTEPSPYFTIITSIIFLTSYAMTVYLIARRVIYHILQLKLLEKESNGLN